MNIPELRNILIKMRINQDCYSIDSPPENEALCLEKVYSNWEIFYFERGSKFEKEMYSQESDACLQFLKRIKKMLGISDSI